MVRPAGFEPATSSVGDWRSIHLSYGREVSSIPRVDLLVPVGAPGGRQSRAHQQPCARLWHRRHFHRVERDQGSEGREGRVLGAAFASAAGTVHTLEAAASDGRAGGWEGQRMGERYEIPVAERRQRRGRRAACQL